MLLRQCDFSIAMLIVFVVSVTGAGVGYGKTIYVDCNSPPGGDGTSWCDAYTDLQDALNKPPTSGDEIWVAEGVYKPTDGSETGISFELVDGVAVYGGYAGCGAAEPNERDIEAYETVLSGAIGGGNQSSFIVVIESVGGDTILDGFEITGGEHGIYSEQSAERIANCVIAGNSLNGIYYNNSSSVAITNCIVRNNGKSGIYCYSPDSMVITNNWIHHNRGEGTDDAGIFFYDPAQAPDIRNNTVVYNLGDGIKKWSVSEPAPKISNCILWGNDGDLNNCTATYSCIEDNPGGEGNIATDPNFAYGNPELYNFHLNPISPCIDVGDSNDVEVGEVDIDGDERIYNGVVDMGADEVVCEDVYSKSDLNGDGIADSVDHLEIIMAWLSWDGECDFDGDGFIDMRDFAIFGAEWQWEACWR